MRNSRTCFFVMNYRCVWPRWWKKWIIYHARLLDMPSVKTVNGWYGTSLHDLHTFKNLPPSQETVKKFTEALQNIRKRHSTVIETLAQVTTIDPTGVASVTLVRSRRLGLHGVLRFRCSERIWRVANSIFSGSILSFSNLHSFTHLPT